MPSPVVGALGYAEMKETQAQIWSIKYWLFGIIGRRQRAESWAQNERGSQSEEWMKNITGGQNITENVFQAYKGPEVTLKKPAE